MIPDIVGQASGRFDQRFFLTAVVPTAVFAPAVASVVLESTGRLSSVSSWYTSQTPVMQVLSWLAVAAIVWFLATLLSSQWNNVVRLYEGYPILRYFAWLNRRFDRLNLPVWFRAPASGVGGHQRRLARIRDRDANLRRPESAAFAAAFETETAALLHDSYPLTMDRVMPTTVGNIIRAAEDYAEHRYGFDSIYLWPRLATVLPKEYLVDVDKAIAAYQTPLMVSFGSALLAVSSLGLANTSISTPLFVAIFLGSLGASWVSYRMSFAAAKDYGDLIRSAVDLFRTDLLKQWWPELLHIDDGRRQFEILREFVLSGTKPTGFISHRPHRPDGHTTGAGETRSRQLIVVENVKRPQPDVATATLEAEGDTPPRFGPRLSTKIAIGALAIAFLAIHHLNEPVWVVVATHNTPPYTQLQGGVSLAQMRRGSVEPDAFASADDPKDLKSKLTALDNSMALHRLVANEVVQRSDIGPAVGKLDGLTIETELSRAQIAALDLRVGDKVFLRATEDSGDPQVCIDGNPLAAVDKSSSSLVDATVLAVEPGPLPDSANLVLQIEASASSCLGDLARVQVMREGPTSPQSSIHVRIRTTREP